jgi:hypothetical protein
MGDKLIVAPAKAGAQFAPLMGHIVAFKFTWIPAFAGMTMWCNALV